MEKETKEKYFVPELATLHLCKCDKDMLQYALNHVDWSEYSDEDFGGEGVMACTEHLKDILNQIDRN